MPNANTGSIRSFRHVVYGALLSLVASTGTLADDIEVFASEAAGIRPNILFVLDYSGSMNTEIDAVDPSRGTRISVLRSAMEDILDQNAKRINAGITIYSSHSSGVLWPVSDLTRYANDIDPDIPRAKNLRGLDIVKNIINNHTAGGYTATVGALMEAALYYSGGNVAAGGVLSADSTLLNPRQWSEFYQRYIGEWYQPHRASFIDNGEGQAASYISPISNQCQKDFVVLISDGVPSRLDEYPELTDYTGPIASCESLSSTIFTSASKWQEMGNCGPEITSGMNADARHPQFADSNVSTYTIGFNIGEEGAKYLSRLAADGGGEFFPAERPEDLTAALDDILDSILGETQSFSELSVDINKATFSDDNRAFFPLFSPVSGNSSWPGNLKGYFIDDEGLKDSNGLPATISDAGSTRFADEAQSFWSASPDGNEVELGGASGKLAGIQRNIYTYTGGQDPDDVPLSGPGDQHHFSADNAALDHTLLDIPDSASLRSELIAWLHQAPMGDALHSKSVPVRYNNRTVVYQATNQGLLHAIDATAPIDPAGGDHSGGEEIFAFIPPELLPNLEKIRNNYTDEGHIYGLDGSVTRWHNDSNNDGIVNENDTLMLIIGMRRGGMHYYALDVSDPEHPRYRWKISGGSIDFPRLAQSWSRMSLITVRRHGKAERVLVFGGGYDAARLDAKPGAIKASGNAIYMIDARGIKLWSADHPDMQFSIASDLRVIDSDDDGYADRIYTGDLGGQLWRIDFDDVAVSGSFKVSKLAELNQGGWQPFFYPPSVALNSRASDEYLSVAIGSGDRTRPLDSDSRNKLYMIKDYNVDKGAPAGGSSTFRLSDLYNATSNDAGSADPSIAGSAQQELQKRKGWYINLASGEKSLSSTLTFEGSLMATTFSPVAEQHADTCAVRPSSSRYYAIAVRDATPAAAGGGLSDVTGADAPAERSKVIASSGIPSSPIVVFPANSDRVQVMVDRTTVSLLEQSLRKIMWYPQH